MTVTNGDILKVILEYAYPGASTALNIFHYVYSGTNSSDEDVTDAVETFLDTGWGPVWADLAPSEASLDNFKVQRVSGVGEVLADVGSGVLTRVGVLGTEVNPAAVALYLMANTASPQIRGAKYVPALSEAAVESGLLTAGATADALLLLVEYLANITITTGERLLPAVLSAKTGGVVTLADSGLINTTPAYQRRRKPSVGI